MAEATMTMRAETPREYQQSVIEVSEDSINSIEKVEEWKVLANGNRMPNGASPRENGMQYLPFFLSLSAPICCRICNIFLV